MFRQVGYYRLGQSFPRDRVRGGYPYISKRNDIAFLLLTVVEETFENTSPYTQDEVIGTVRATGGVTPYTWKILSQTLQ